MLQQEMICMFAHAQFNNYRLIKFCYTLQKPISGTHRAGGGCVELETAESGHVVSRAGDVANLE